MLDLFVLWDTVSGGKVPVAVNATTEQDLAATKDWQTSWETPYVRGLPNKVALWWAFGARRAASYDPFRMIIWEDVSERIIAEFRRDSNV